MGTALDKCRLRLRAPSPPTMIAKERRMTRTLSWLSLVALFAATPGLFAADVIDPATAKADGDMLWYDIRPLGVEGQGWKDVKAPYDRLPEKAVTTVREPVWNLSRHSAGMCVRFVTDAPALQARWT